MNEEVREELRGASLWLTIDRPARRNAINAQVILALEQALARARRDPAVRALVLTGAGDAFCAGADLQGDAFEFDTSEPELPFANLLRAAHRSTVPLIARVNGACMAGGMGLLAMCHMAVAADDARFGLPEVKVGVFPFQVMALLQGLVGRRRLYEWSVTGEPLTAAQALDAGLLNYVVPRAELDQRIDWLLARLADKSPSAIRRGLYAMSRIEAMPFEEAMAFMEGQLGLAAFTADAREGVKAFRERRPPVWTGR